MASTTAAAHTFRRLEAAGTCPNGPSAKACGSSEGGADATGGSDGNPAENEVASAGAGALSPTPASGMGVVAAGTSASPHDKGVPQRVQNLPVSAFSALQFGQLFTV
jgi:hypothetical protein